MKHFLSAFKALSAVAKNFARPPVTQQFPQVIRPRPERYRASFALLHEEDGDEACIGCLACERICPSKVISMKGPVKKDSPVTGKKRSYAEEFTLDLAACIQCELCVQVCPADALVMTREPEAPAYTREELVLTMEKLYANEKSKTRSWGDGTKLMGMQTPPKPAPVAVPAVAKPAAMPGLSEPVEDRPAKQAAPAVENTAAQAVIAAVGPSSTSSDRPGASALPGASDPPGAPAVPPAVLEPKS